MKNHVSVLFGFASLNRCVSWKSPRIRRQSESDNDAVYRRAVTADTMAHYDEVSDFLAAVRDNVVFLAGSFATQVIHTKWLFYVLHHERTAAVFMLKGTK